VSKAINREPLTFGQSGSCSLVNRASIRNLALLRMFDSGLLPTDLGLGIRGRRGSLALDALCLLRVLFAAYFARAGGLFCAQTLPSWSYLQPIETARPFVAGGV
jgi:hypothetical protein